MDEIHILLIEDDLKIINFLSLALKTSGYKLSVASSGKSGIMSYCTGNPNILLLDLGLPDIDGIDIIKEIRKVSQIPILIISARGQEADKIEALDAGANDYMTKPFSTGELLARIRVMERFIERDILFPSNPVVMIGDLKVDMERHRVFIEEEEIHFTQMEYKLLILLVKNRGKVITHSQIKKEVWGYSETGDAKSIRVCMASIRRKLEKESMNSRYIYTEIGVGYRFADA